MNEGKQGQTHAARHACAFSSARAMTRAHARMRIRTCKHAHTSNAHALAHACARTRAERRVRARAERRVRARAERRVRAGTRARARSCARSLKHTNRLTH
eukprot:6191898-Pleurochrysis_carterae.AAC.4